jgi:hypothetical protein
MKRPGIREQSLIGALGHEAIEAGVFGEDVGFFLEDVAQGVFILGHGWRKCLRTSGLEPRRVEGVIGSIPVFFVHANCRLDQAADGGSQDRAKYVGALVLASSGQILIMLFKSA